MIYVGLDLHKRYITACAIDVAGQVIAEERRLLTDLPVVSAWLGRLTGPVTVVLEATLYWAWLEQQLTALGYVVQVAHPYQVKLIWHARTKTDPIDARKLAELARVHLLPAIWIPDPTTRAQRHCCAGGPFSSGSERSSRIAFTPISPGRTSERRSSICMAAQAAPGSRR